MKNQKGFTLIELMVVIVIIGILAAIAIPSMSGVSDKARASEAINSIGAFENLQSAYSIEDPNNAGSATNIGFMAPTGSDVGYSTVTAGTLDASFVPAINSCGHATAALNNGWKTVTTTGTNPWGFTHTIPGGANCSKLTPNFI